MFDYEDEFNAGGYDGFGRDDDYNIWEENQLAGEDEGDEDFEDEIEDNEPEGDWDGPEDAHLESAYEDQNGTSLGWWGD